MSVIELFLTNSLSVGIALFIVHRWIYSFFQKRLEEEKQRLKSEYERKLEEYRSSESAKDQIFNKMFELKTLFILNAGEKENIQIINEKYGEFKALLNQRRINKLVSQNENLKHLLKFENGIECVVYYKSNKNMFDKILKTLETR